jgi:hypothetical protein
MVPLLVAFYDPRKHTGMYMLYAIPPYPRGGNPLYLLGSGRTAEANLGIGRLYVANPGSDS